MVCFVLVGRTLTQTNDRTSQAWRCTPEPVILWTNPGIRYTGSLYQNTFWLKLPHWVPSGVPLTLAGGSAAKGTGAKSVVSRASGKNAGGAKKVPVMEENFRDDDEKHKKWSSRTSY